MGYTETNWCKNYEGENGNKRTSNSFKTGFAHYYCSQQPLGKDTSMWWFTVYPVDIDLVLFAHVEWKLGILKLEKAAKQWNS